jgi:methionyl-tRNA formyltransferase
MGAADFGLATLKALHENHDIPAVVTCCDSKKGRGRKVQPSPVKIAALEDGLDVLEPVTLDDPEFIKKLAEYRADLFYVVAFRLLPGAVFSLPPRGTVNLHASLLPDYRGAAPINWAVINGDAVTGLTTFFINDAIDTGDIILSGKVAIGPDETAGELAERMKGIGAGLSLKTVELIEKNAVERIQQPASGKRPAPKLFKTDGLIDWTKDARSIHNQVRGMNPVPGAYIQSDKGPLKIHRTQLLEETSGTPPGLITLSSPKEGFVVSCGRGSLRIMEIQPPGKNCMDSASFVRGYKVTEGMRITETL